MPNGETSGENIFKMFGITALHFSPLCEGETPQPPSLLHPCVQWHHCHCLRKPPAGPWHDLRHGDSGSQLTPRTAISCSSSISHTALCCLMQHIQHPPAPTNSSTFLLSSCRQDFGCIFPQQPQSAALHSVTFAGSPAVPAPLALYGLALPRADFKP